MAPDLTTLDLATLAWSFPVFNSFCPLCTLGTIILQKKCCSKPCIRCTTFITTPSSQPQSHIVALTSDRNAPSSASQSNSLSLSLPEPEPEPHGKNEVSAEFFCFFSCLVCAFSRNASERTGRPMHRFSFAGLGLSIQKLAVWAPFFVQSHQNRLLFCEPSPTMFRLV